MKAIIRYDIFRTKRFIKNLKRWFSLRKTIFGSYDELYDTVYELTLFHLKRYIKTISNKTEIKRISTLIDLLEMYLTFGGPVVENRVKNVNINNAKRFLSWIESFDPANPDHLTELYYCKMFRLIHKALENYAKLCIY